MAAPHKLSTAAAVARVISEPESVFHLEKSKEQLV